MHPTLVEASSGQEWYYIRSAWHLVSLWVRQICDQIYPTHYPPMPPLWPQVETSGGQEWYSLGSHSPEIMFYCLQCSIDHLEFSRVLCNRPSSFFRCNPQPSLPPVNPLVVPPKYRHLVVKIGTTTGQHDIWSACGSDWPLLRCTPTPYAPTSW